jgi:ribonuclease HI
MSLPQQSRTSTAKAYFERKQFSKGKSHHRTIRIITTTIGEYRTFAGRIDISNAGTGTGGKQRDADHLHDIASLYNDGKALAYWTDGSLRKSKDMDDVLGAGVAWQEKDGQGKWAYKTSMYSLGVNTGTSADAELFGIAAGLRLAVEKAEKDVGVKHVRILSDCVRVMKGIQDGTITLLGPAVSSPWALQQVYDHADILVRKGIKIELVWVKGHALSEGNAHADRAAAEVVKMQKGSKEKARFVKWGEAPACIAAMGRDSVEEWYWRVNRERHLQGKEEGDEESEDDESEPMDISDDDSASSTS